MHVLVCVCVFVRAVVLVGGLAGIEFGEGPFYARIVDTLRGVCEVEGGVGGDGCAYIVATEEGEQ